MIFSYTLLRDDSNCSEAVRQIQVLKNYKKTFTGDMLNGTDVHGVLENYIKSKTDTTTVPFGQSLVDAFRKQGTVEAEVALAVNHWLQPVSFWGGNGIGHQVEPLIRGKLDVTTTAGDTALYADWKTGTPRENNELQFKIGALLLFQARPEINTVHGMNVWLKTGKMGQPYTFKREQVSLHWAPLIRKMQEIEKRDKTVEWSRTPSALCGWCPVASCEHFQGNRGR